MLHNGEQLSRALRIEFALTRSEVRKKAQEIISMSEQDIVDLKKWQSAHR
ncbi:MAG: hypothetical protein ACREXP_21260 [Steroidobacteraceae bacterium]